MALEALELMQSAVLLPTGRRVELGETLFLEHSRQPVAGLVREAGQVQAVAKEATARSTQI